jgi:uroporphyrinogen-III synthase
LALKDFASGAYAWLVVPSGNAARRVVARLEAAGLKPHVDTRVATVGPSTARDLERGGLEVDLLADPHTSQALVEAIGRGDGRILLPRAAGGPREFPHELAALGWDVHEVPAYRNLPVEPESSAIDRVRSGDFDVITLTSASAARALASLATPPPNAVIACIGPSTADGARAAGLPVDVVAEEHTVPGLVKAIIEHVRGMAR